MLKPPFMNTSLPLHSSVSLLYISASLLPPLYLAVSCEALEDDHLIVEADLELLNLPVDVPCLHATEAPCLHRVTGRQVHADQTIRCHTKQLLGKRTDLY